MTLVGRLRGLLRRHDRRRLLERARRAEARGELGHAAALYLAAGHQEDASRIYELRADAAPEPTERLLLLSQAAQHARGQRQATLARRRALVLLEQVREGRHRLARIELSELAQQLSSAGEHDAAAEAYGLAGDVEAQASALIDGGNVESLETLLEAEGQEARAARDRLELVLRVRELEAVGDRRSALLLAREAGLLGQPNDERLTELARDIERRRVVGPRVELELEGELVDVALGHCVTVGRSEAGILVSSPRVSRTHLAIALGPQGAMVTDLGSSNGTFLAGARLKAPVSVGGGIELELGGAVTMLIRPHRRFGLELMLADARIWLPLAAIPVSTWHIELADDDWVELVTNRTPCFHAKGRCGERIGLLKADAFAEAPSSNALVRVP